MWLARFGAKIQIGEIPTTLRYQIDEQDLISEQGGKFPKINKRAGLNKQAGWKIGKNLIKEQDWINEQIGIMIQITNYLIEKL